LSVNAGISYIFENRQVESVLGCYLWSCGFADKLDFS